ncbi:ABC transporter ATP-binding protein [Catellatospora citrea]|uniref:Spermidine/putrescine import ATP-binding protein PotA n=1 Tax=Catellatospora citrea TaxID=53366 RepID=A0A8J3KI47_9ACTN|nr:ABC transporter ATP-binding protein [Catellatospora citrea]RKE10692.1 iron(III) transport system ATP-binding protein [Catellatospora citrea]GIG01175.1 spermidine/putrescine import ATP-binding protein PotA [Catellatospora citrea]
MTTIAPPLTTSAEQQRTGDGHLQLNGITKVFPGATSSVTAVDTVDLDVAPGEFLTLLGPSGCGKTTTLRIVAGFESATSGSLHLDGVAIERTAPQHRQMAMVFQSYALFPHLTVRENLEYGLKLKRRSRAEIANATDVALTSMNLVGLGDRSPHQLSGGQQQRVALARALVIQPKVLLFDEPLSNLDAKLRGAMRAEIRRVQRMLGITSLYVTHDQDEAMSMSDRIVVMNGGRVEQVATPAEIYLRPATVFVADFIGRANFLECVVERLVDGHALVTALGATLTVPAHSSAATPGLPAYLMLRPEVLQLAPVTEGGNGAILSATFHGPTVDYEVETAAGTLSVTQPGADPTTLLAEGTRVYVSLDARRAYLLPRG